jgi:hypothetical protein
VHLGAPFLLLAYILKASLCCIACNLPRVALLDGDEGWEGLYIKANSGYDVFVMIATYLSSCGIPCKVFITIFIMILVFILWFKR